MRKIAFIVFMLAITNAQGSEVDRVIEMSCGSEADHYAKAFVYLDKQLREKMNSSITNEELYKAKENLADLLEITADENYKTFRKKLEDATTDEGRFVYRIAAATSSYVGSVAKRIWYSNMLKNKERYIRIIDEDCRSEMRSRIK